MLQSGLTRLKSVFSEAKDSAKDSAKDGRDPRSRPPGGHTSHAPALRSASVSAPAGLRPDQARQLLSKKVSVPVLGGGHHGPLQLSRSVPVYPHHQHLASPAGCPAHRKQIPASHRKLARAATASAAVTGAASESARRERARSHSAALLGLGPHELLQLHHRGAKRRRQDHNRNIYNAEKDSVSSSESNPEDHIYEEIDSDYFATKEEEVDTVEDNFLLSISLERQRNLRFYGSAGWDFGNVC